MKTSNNVYIYKAVEDYIVNTLEPLGYEIIQIEGSLVDNFICYAPDDKHYNFIFLEKYLNEWSSGIVYHKCKKIGKSEQEVIDRLMEMKEEQEREIEEYFEKRREWNQKMQEKKESA